MPLRWRFKPERLAHEGNGCYSVGMIEDFDSYCSGDGADAGAWLDSLPSEQLAALNEMLDEARRELDAGLGVEFDVDDILARGRARRAARMTAAAE